MRRFDKTKTIQRANLLAESRYLESKGLVRENYSVQNFVTDFHDAEFFTPFLQAIVKNGVDLRNTEDWNEIITMDRNQLRNTFGLFLRNIFNTFSYLVKGTK